MWYPLICDLASIDSAPSHDPFPIPAAAVPVITIHSAPSDEPMIAAKNGNMYFRLTPYIAGSVTPSQAEVVAGYATCFTFSSLRFIIPYISVAAPCAVFEIAKIGNKIVPPIDPAF